MIRLIAFLLVLQVGCIVSELPVGETPTAVPFETLAAETTAAPTETLTPTPVPETRTVRFLHPDGTEFFAQTVEKGACVDAPPFDPAERTLLGWFSDGYSAAWSFDNPVTEDLTLRAICTDFMQKTTTRIAYQDLDDYTLRGAETNAVLVLFLRYTDGYEYDEAVLKKVFTAESDSLHRLSSVASYYKYNSYGKADFEFHFFCYDTGMTCKQAYDFNLQKPHQLIWDALLAAKQSDQTDSRAWDRDGDGYIDLVAVIGGEDATKTVGDGDLYYIFPGSTAYSNEKANKTDPEMCLFLKSPYERIMNEPKSLDTGSGPRVLIHEIGHAFGLMDYYDYMGYSEREIDAVGVFDMQSGDMGDWNPFSRFACGWLDPYVITEDVDTVTLKLGCSSEVGDAILIPTSKGWNGTAFDEYLLIDVAAPVGANGFDWQYCMRHQRNVAANEYSEKVYHSVKNANKDGGVRIYHVDARLLKQTVGTGFERIPDYDALSAILNDPEYGRRIHLTHAYTNSNGYEPYLEDDSRYYHLIELVPSDGRSKYRLSSMGTTAIFIPMDLFGPGETFSMQTCANAFPDAPYMNNGGTLNYTVTVEHYDPETHEAIVTVAKVPRGNLATER